MDTKPYGTYGYVVARKDPETGNLIFDPESVSWSLEGAWDDCRNLNGEEWANAAAQAGRTAEIRRTATYLPYLVVIPQDVETLEGVASGYAVEYLPKDSHQSGIDESYQEDIAFPIYADAINEMIAAEAEHSKHISVEERLGEYTICVLLDPFDSKVVALLSGA